MGLAQSVVSIGNVLVVPAMSEEVGLIGLDKKTGKELWKTEGFGDSHSTPTVLNLHGVEQVVFVATLRDGDDGTGTTLSVLPETGEVLWKTDIYFNKIPIPFATKVTEELVWLTGGYDCGSCMVKVRNDGGDWTVEKVFDKIEGTQIHPPLIESISSPTKIAIIKAKLAKRVDWLAWILMAKFSGTPARNHSWGAVT